MNLETKLLRGILTYHQLWKRIEPEYSRLQESGESPGRALTSEESVRLFATAEAKQEWLVAFLAAVVANDSGMRGVELRNLRLRDVDLNAKRIAIRRSKIASSTRTVVLTNDAYKAILRLVDRAYKLNSVAPDHFLFPYRDGKRMAYDPSRPTKGWRTAWRRLTKVAGLPGFRFHDLRHTFITSHAEIGTPLPVIMVQAGHLSKRMTEIYTHISTRSLEEAAQRFEQKKAEAIADAKRKLEIQPTKSASAGVN